MGFQLFFVTSCHTDEILISFSVNALKWAIKGNPGVIRLGGAKKIAFS
jgi:hypothetical protein